MNAAARAWARRAMLVGLVVPLGCGARDPIDDECPTDPNKDRPGICGCGVPDDDADGNGVPDCFDETMDLCPDDPQKTLPGACGCGVADDDADGDGVPNCFDETLDLCPDDPDKTLPGICGCGVADDDTDGSGIPDCLDGGLDLCPADPDKVFPGVCGCGMPDDDANANGVPDCLDSEIDLCPDDRDKTLPGTCGCGVSDDDSDANGVPDCLDGGFDLCPGDPDKTLPGVCGCGVPDTDFDDNGLPDCLVPLGDGEPWDNERSGATTLSAGVPAQGYIWYAGDRDWYAVEATAGQILRVEWETPQSPLEPYLRLEDPDGNRIWALSASAEQGDTSISSGNRGATSTGTYHVRIEDYEGDDFSDTIPYLLTVFVEDSPDAGEPDNDTQAGAVPIGPATPTEGYIGHVQDEDWFQFDAVAGQQLQVTLTMPERPLDPFVELVSPNGTVAWTDEATGSGAVSLDSGPMTAGYGGTYALHVMDVDSNEYDTTVPYTLTVMVAGP